MSTWKKVGLCWLCFGCDGSANEVTAPNRAVAKEDAPALPPPPSEKDKLSSSKGQANGSGRRSKRRESDTPLLSSGDDGAISPNSSSSVAAVAALPSPTSASTGEQHSDKSDDDLSEDEIITGEGEEEPDGSNYLEPPDDAEIQEVKVTVQVGIWADLFAYLVFGILVQMDALFDQLRHSESGLKRRDIGSFNKIKDCFRAFEVVMWLMTRLGIEEEVMISLFSEGYQPLNPLATGGGASGPAASTTRLYLSTARRWRRPLLQFNGYLQVRGGR